MSQHRYAIYLAPRPDTPLWAFGSRVLGYDAATGQDVSGFSPRGFDAELWHRITDRPRQYGFHATLKAPFKLADGKLEEELITELEAFSFKCSSFDLGPLSVEAIDHDNGNGFVALTPQRDSPELEALEHDVVHVFDHFRAALTPEDFARRKPEALNPRQRASLIRFGYPFVGADYRFHMTLSGSIPNAADVADALADDLANDVGTVQFNVESLVVFGQASPTERFRILQSFALKKR